MVEIAVCQPHGTLFTSAYPSEDWVRPFCHGGKRGWWATDRLTTKDTKRTQLTVLKHGEQHAEAAEATGLIGPHPNHA